MAFKMTFEDFVVIRNKYYGEPIKVITPANEPIYMLREETPIAVMEMEHVEVTTQNKRKRKVNIDELAEKRRKKREKNRARNEYERQFNANRKIVLVLDNNKCRECGSTEGLHVHHIKERCKGGTNDINNLITLCGSCHREKHKGENVYNIM